MTRREAAKLIGAGAAGVASPVAGLHAATKEASASMLTRTIPSTGEKLPVIGLGTWSVFDVNLTPDKQNELGGVLSLLVKHGGKVVDSSPMYGRAEGVVGELLTKLRLHDSIFIATKVWTSGKEAGIKQMERSMELFQTKRIDLIQVHNLVDVDTQMGTLREWKSKGRICYTGITHSQASGFYAIEDNMRRQKPDFVQINYSLMEPGAAQRIFPLAQELRMGVIINRPFGGGGLFRRVMLKPLPDWASEIGCKTWAQFFLKWIIAHPAVSCVVPATNNPQHMEDNVAAGTGRLPDPSMRQRMLALIGSF
jgi:diketogulonate reductase-like aldo/keto reductase